MANNRGIQPTMAHIGSRPKSKYGKSCVSTPWEGLDVHCQIWASDRGWNPLVSSEYTGRFTSLFQINDDNPPKYWWVQHRFHQGKGFHHCSRNMNRWLRLFLRTSAYHEVHWIYCSMFYRYRKILVDITEPCATMSILIICCSTRRMMQNPKVQACLIVLFYNIWTILELEGNTFCISCGFVHNRMAETSPPCRFQMKTAYQNNREHQYIYIFGCVYWSFIDF